MLATTTKKGYCIIQSCLSWVWLGGTLAMTPGKLQPASSPCPHPHQTRLDQGQARQRPCPRQHERLASLSEVNLVLTGWCKALGHSCKLMRQARRKVHAARRKVHVGRAGSWLVGTPYSVHMHMSGTSRSTGGVPTRSSTRHAWLLTPFSCRSCSCSYRHGLDMLPVPVQLLP